MPRTLPWTRDELLIALRMYMRLPFGRLHRGNPEIVSLAARLSRTPSALSMKACNFASFDPSLQARGVRGLSGASRADREVWDEFAGNPESLAAEAEAAFARLSPAEPPVESPDWPLPAGETDVLRLIRARRVQSFFRAAVLTSYGDRCAISGLPVRELLVASHIIPWHASVPRRADPTNGLCLHALFDRAFDRGLLTIDPDLKVIVSPHLRTTDPTLPVPTSLAAAHGRPLTIPTRFPPDPDALAYHRENVFHG